MASSIFRRIYITKVAHNVRCFVTKRNPKRTSESPKLSKSKLDESEPYSKIPSTNELGIPMISEKLHQRLFGNNSQCDGNENYKRIKRRIAASIGENCFNENSSTNSAISDNVNIELPELCGNSLDDHFRMIAEDQVRDYRKLAKDFVDIPDMPKKEDWKMTPGWTRYSKDGPSISVDYPQEDALVFDVEVCIKAGGKPTLAVAVSKKAWYSWCSEDLCGKTLHRDHLPKTIQTAESFFNGNVTSDVDGRAELDSISMEDYVTSKCSYAKNIELDDLIRLESKHGEQEIVDSRKKLVIGHNVAFDRSYVTEQYFLDKTNLRFLDTMSMHIATNGFAHCQRIVHMKRKNSQEKEGFSVDNGRNSNNSQDQESANDWESKGSMNSLEAVHAHYCKNGKTKISKDQRELFINEDIAEIRAKFSSCMEYCANDVYATFEVFRQLLPDFLERFPHPVTLSGMLEMGTAYLPVSDNWWHFIESAEESYNAELGKINALLVRLANDAVQLLRDNKYMDDPWLWDEDWSTTNEDWSFYKKAASSKENQRGKSRKRGVEELWDVFAERMRKSPPYLPEFPNWYKTLCNGASTKPETVAKVLSKECDTDSMPDWGPRQITVNMRIAPKLLRMHYLGYPLYCSSKFGWGYLVPANKCGDLKSYKQVSPGHYEVELQGKKKAIFPLRRLEEIVKENREKLAGLFKSEDKDRKDSLDILPGVSFYRLPHKNGDGINVGNPLAKDFLRLIEDGKLNSQHLEHAQLLAKVNETCSYWKITRDRILSQLPVLFYQFDGNGRKIRTRDKYGDICYGAIVPRVITAGTITRRAVEPLWMTASNVKENRIGSEVKGLIQAPPGYVFVGADVDSQELWIASLLGDSQEHKIHGCTPFSWMLLRGNKSDGTDQHSLVAAELGITRDQAKILNYGRIYGAGQPFATVLLKKFRSDENAEKIHDLARRLYYKTKGKRVKYFSLKDDVWKRLEDSRGTSGLTKDRVLFADVKNIGREFNKQPDECFTKEWTEWENGTESDVFNRLENIALSEKAATPVLGCRLSRTLELGSKNTEFLPSRINWVVQSSAVDYLHLMLSCMRWLFDKYKIDGRFSISIHDEVRYLVAEKDQYRAALALQITNLLTRAMFVSSVGMTGLPQSVAYFSKVDIDKALRKEVNIDGVTPSNKLGLHKLYGIPEGTALDINQIIERTNGGRLDITT